MALTAPALAATRSRGEPLSYDLAPVAIALATFALCAFSPALFNDGDTFTHIAAGEWMIAHRAVPHVDPLTSSFAGQPWTAQEWLSEVLLAAAYRAGGFIGDALLTGAAAALAVLLILRRVARDLGGPALAVVGALSLMLIAPTLLARPHILALPILALWAQRLLDSRERAPPIAFALWMAPWANLHGGFAVGLALIGPCGLEAILAAAPERRLALTRDWALFALAALLAALASPLGFDGLAFPVRLLGLKSLANIGEWAPADFAKPNELELALLALVAVALTRPVRVPPIRLALLIGLAHLSLAHVRHELLLATLGPMLLAGPLAAALDAPGAPGGLDRRLAGLAAAVLAIALARPLLPAPKIPGFASAEAGLAALPSGLRAEPGLNGYGLGGYLELAGVKPYVDGRADLFGDAFLADYARLARGDREALTAALDSRRIGWTMFAPAQGAVATLDSLPGWRRAYADARLVVHARIAPLRGTLP
jgi:hypothetical protein